MYRLNDENKKKIKEILKANMQSIPEKLIKVIDSDEQLNKMRFEFLTYLGLLPSALNPHIEFAHQLQENISDIEKKRMIEYSCGYVPGLSIACQSILPLESQIVAYDEKLLPIEHKRIISSTTRDLLENQNYDVLISFLVRDNLSEVLAYATDHNLEFLIQSYSQKNENIESHFKYLIEWKNKVEQMSPDMECKLIFSSFSRQISSPLLLSRKKTKENGL